LTFDAYRRNQNSILLVDQNSRGTGAAIAVHHDLSTIYHFHLGGGYEFRNYYATQSGVSAPREDDYFFVRAAANWDVTDRINVGLFYQFRQNDSNDPSLSFDDNQVGLTLAYRF
jgi:uncharacterized protein (PEP-CTERM system associated)